MKCSTVFWSRYYEERLEQRKNNQQLKKGKKRLPQLLFLGTEFKSQKEVKRTRSLETVGANEVTTKNLPIFLR